MRARTQQRVAEMQEWMVSGTCPVCGYPDNDVPANRSGGAKCIPNWERGYTREKDAYDPLEEDDGWGDDS